MRWSWLLCMEALACTLGAVQRHMAQAHNPGLLAQGAGSEQIDLRESSCGEDPDRVWVRAAGCPVSTRQGQILVSRRATNLCGRDDAHAVGVEQQAWSSWRGSNPFSPRGILGLKRGSEKWRSRSSSTTKIQQENPPGDQPRSQSTGLWRQRRVRLLPATRAEDFASACPILVGDPLLHWDLGRFVGVCESSAADPCADRPPSYGERAKPEPLRLIGSTGNGWG